VGELLAATEMGRQDLLQAGGSTGAVTLLNRLSLQQDGSSPMSVLPAPMLYAGPCSAPTTRTRAGRLRHTTPEPALPWVRFFRSVQPHPSIWADSEPLQRLGSSAKDAKSDTNFRT